MESFIPHERNQITSIPSTTITPKEVTSTLTTDFDPCGNWVLTNDRHRVTAPLECSDTLTILPKISYIPLVVEHVNLR